MPTAYALPRTLVHPRYFAGSQRDRCVTSGNYASRGANVRASIEVAYSCGMMLLMVRALGPQVSSVARNSTEVTKPKLFIDEQGLAVVVPVVVAGLQGRGGREFTRGT